MVGTLEEDIYISIPLQLSCKFSSITVVMIAYE